MATPSNMLAVELRRSEPIQLSVPLKRYVRSAYAESEDQYADDFRLLEVLRNDVLKLDVHPTSLGRLIKYYGQLQYVMAKFPIDENNIRVCFPWFGAFSKDRRPVNQYHVHFEQASVLFNIAAMYSLLASQESRASEEGVKKSCDLFQRAAGAFTHLSDALASHLRGFSVPLEMSTPALLCLTNVMMAQAQECVWLKAVAGNMKDGTIAKLAMKVSEYYNVAYESIESSMAAQMPLMTHWVTHIRAKALHFDAAAQYRKAMEVQSEAKYGEEITRLRDALSRIKMALENQKYIAAAVVQDLKGLDKYIQTALTKAEKDNDIVYLQPVPAMTSVSIITSMSMVKPVPFTLQEHQRIIGTPLFGRLVSFATHQLVSEYEEVKRKVVSTELRKLEELRSLTWSTLGNLELPGSIAAIEQPDGLPSNVIDRCTEFIQEGGVHYLRNNIDTVNNLAATCERIIQEVEIMLENEENEDKELHAQFKERWQRTTSANLQQNMKEKMRDFRSKLSLAQRSDELVRDKILSNIVDLERLESTRGELERLIPASTIGITMRDQVYLNLKSELTKVEKRIQSWDVLMAKIKETATTDDINRSLVDLTNLNQEVNKEQAFSKQLQQYDTFKQQIAQQEMELDKEMEQVKVANSVFMQAKANSTASREREYALQALDRAYKLFVELRSNCSEGVKFYADFEKVLHTFRVQVRDYCHARSIEKKDLLSELTSNIANMDMSHPMDYNSMPTAPPLLPPRSDMSPSQRGGNYPGHPVNSMGGIPTPPSVGQWTPGAPLVFQQQQQQNNNNNPYGGVPPPVYPGYWPQNTSNDANHNNNMSNYGPR